MKYLFLDLENTVIHTWDDPIIMNNLEIRKKIKEINPDTFGIYSFAIWNKEDKKIFIENIMPELNESFNININLEFVFSLPEILKLVLDGKQMEIEDFINYFGKELSFIKFCRTYFKRGEIFLIDDAVHNSFVSDEYINIRFINPFSKIN